VEVEGAGKVVMLLANIYHALSHVVEDIGSGRYFRPRGQDDLIFLSLFMLFQSMALL
jgi:hypothetical protein